MGAVDHHLFAEEIASRFGSSADADAIEANIYEIVSCLPDVRMDAISAEIELFEETGVMTAGIENLLRRATCMAEADRITRRFS